MSNNNDTSLPAMDGDIAAHPDSSYAGFSNMSRTPEPSGEASLDEISDHMDGLSEEELEAYMSKWFGEGFTNHTKDIFAHAVLTVTESMNEELEELVGITEVLAERVCELERELIFREVTGEMITTNRERFRAQVEHIEYDDDVSFKTKLLTEKRRLFGKTTGNPDPLHEEYAYQPPAPDRLIQLSMDAVKKFQC